MKDDVICVARYRQVGHGTIGLRENSSFARFASRRTSNSDTNKLPEGANRKVICREQRIDDIDFFGMLMATVGTDMIGSVNFREVEDE